ncbi:MFS transporter [Actinorhabdospora filicis]|uniref:MFS transporter n=1 Tax=Actinorhabdospora filicis TaxID=1785913 RepID=A0A9W6SKX3_9ACTN|nr:MFS transporter [Actinorhabdospora filicis]GLZ78884.1 MFS transporter [Actinorhabdospora filicis]
MTSAVLDQKSPSPPPPPGRAGKGSPWLTMLAVALGVMVVGLDATVVSIANPKIAEHFKADLSDLQWVTNGYLLALAVLLIPAGKLADRFGRKKIFLIGVVAFTLASMGVGFASSIGMVIGWRVVQGIGGALLQPAALAIIRNTFPAEKLNMAIGLFSATVGLSIASGPVVGGLLVEHADWRWVFFVNAPVAVVGLFVGVWVIRESRDEESDGSFDLTGIVLLIGALFGLVWGLIKAQEYGFGDKTPIISFIAAGVLFVLFFIREAMARKPLLPLALFKSLPLSIGTLLMIGGFFAMFGSLFFLMLWMQNVHGMSPIEAGVRVLPMTGVMLLASPLAGLLTQKFGPRPPLVIGMLTLAGSLYAFSRFEVETTYSAIWPWLTLFGVSFSLVMVAGTEAIIGNAPARLAGIAGGLQQTAGQLGGVLGTSILGVLLVNRVGDVLAPDLIKAGVPEQMANAPELAQAIPFVAQGIAPINEKVPVELHAPITTGAHNAFMEGFSHSLTVAAIVAVAGAVAALLVRKGQGSGGGVVHM